MAKTCPKCNAINLQSASTCTHCGSNLEVINKPTEELNDIVRDEVLSEPNVDKNSKKEEKPGMFRNPFSFKGRIRRTEYGISFIIISIINGFITQV